jgi:hypothetical protein
MEFENLTSDQVVCVLEEVHNRANDFQEKLGTCYSNALVTVFHDLWNTLEKRN